MSGLPLHQPFSGNRPPQGHASHPDIRVWSASGVVLVLKRGSALRICEMKEKRYLPPYPHMQRWDREYNFYSPKKPKTKNKREREAKEIIGPQKS